MQKTFQYLPHQRRLNRTECSDVITMFEKKAGNKLIQQHVQSNFGKNITTKDIHNMATRKVDINKTALKRLVIEMEKIPGSLTNPIEVAKSEMGAFIKSCVFNQKEKVGD